MRSFFLPEGSALSDQQFTQSALESPLSAWQTLGYSARTAMEQSALGTLAREAQAPDLALEPGPTPNAPPPRSRDPLNFAAPRPPSDQPFGMPPSYDRVQTPAQVAARGDRLYQTDGDYKASPWYRENIPFEPGMTEARAKALAEMSDLTAIRNYYTSKRPVTSFIGSVAGAALAPENYIPILGESAAAVTTARVGKVAGRMLLSGSDAALNAAAFQLLTMQERARLGDDTSWQAFMENTAFAALAGTAFGGIFGGVEKIRERYLASPAQAGSSRIRSDQVGSDRIKSDQIAPDLTMGGDVPATMAPDYLRPTDVLDRVETPVARARANAVLNDAVTALAIDGEVRLGENSQAEVDAWSRLAGETNARPGPYQPRRPQNVMEFIASIGGIRDVNGELKARDLTWENTRTRDGTMVRQGGLAPDQVREALVQAGYLDDPGMRTGGMSTTTPDDVFRLIDKQLGGDQVVAVRDQQALTDWETHQQGLEDRAAFNAKTTPEERKFIKSNGFEFYSWLKENGLDPASVKRADAALAVKYWHDGMTFDEAYDRAWKENLATEESPPPPPVKPKKPITRSFSYSVPAPEPQLPQLSASYRLVDSLPKASTPEVKRLIEQAKAEGFDPEAGTTDLDTDIEIMRQLDALTEDEAAALAAADETFKAAEAWGDVAEQLIACKASNA